MVARSAQTLRFPLVTHSVRIITEPDRARGVCVCGWSSPWRTNRSIWPDRVLRAAPPSPMVLAERAAHTHLRTAGRIMGRV
jgi:hypothetical protein